MFSVRSSGYQLGCTVTVVSAQRPVEHVKNALQNIATEGMKHSVVFHQLYTYPANNSLTNLIANFGTSCVAKYIRCYFPPKLSKGSTTSELSRRAKRAGCRHLTRRASAVICKGREGKGDARRLLYPQSALSLGQILNFGDFRLVVQLISVVV